MNVKSAIERMAKAAATDSLPSNGMFNSDQLDRMKSERMPMYREIAKIMLQALLRGGEVTNETE